MLRRGGALLAALCCAVGLSSASTDPCASDQPPCRAPAGVLSFADEFHSLDFRRWMTTYPWGGRNLDGPGGPGELQQYVDPTYKQLGLNPFSVEPRNRQSAASGTAAPCAGRSCVAEPNPASCDGAIPGRGSSGEPAGSPEGVLSIRADRVGSALARQLDGREFTSGLLTTFRSFSQTYGYFEMCARLPYGRGLWPAFWLLPIDRSWPPEIDVMEELGHQPTTLYVTVHNRGRDGKDRPTGFERQVADMSEGFHRYGLLWSPRFLAWYFDGYRVAFTRTPVGLNRPMYLLVNLAVGGSWAGTPDASTRFPATMQIHYIRAYRLPP